MMLKRLESKTSLIHDWQLFTKKGQGKGEQRRYEDGDPKELQCADHRGLHGI
jgi:hypothetical protein